MAFFIIHRDIAHYKHIEEININMLVMLKLLPIFAKIISLNAINLASLQYFFIRPFVRNP